MKKKFILLPFLLAAVYLVGSSYSGGPASSGVDGAMATTTAGCNCHTFNASTTVAMELDTLGGGAVTTYVPGGNYTIKLTGTNTSSTSLPKFGFQITSVRLAGAGTGAAVYAGTMATTGLPSGTHNVAYGAIRMFEHTLALTPTSGTGGSGTTYVRTINWTAPSAGTGSVKFCGVVNAVNGTGGTDGDRYNSGSVTIPERVAAITGASTVCAGANTSLANTTTGGTWSSGATSVATVSSTGVVYGVSAGTVTISYNAGTSGIATTVITVNPVPVAGTITVPGTVCTGAPVTMTTTGSVGTGSWSTTTPAIVSINASTGVLTPLSAGTAIISYSVTNSCGSSSAGLSFAVTATPTGGTITGVDSVCVGGATSLTATGATPGGTWTTTSSSIATVNSAGTVFGAAAGTTVVSYSVSNACGTATSVRSVIVKPATTAGTISGPSSVCFSGGTISLASTVPGGVWSSATPTFATVNASTGVVTGVGAGPATISYTVTGFCGTAVATYPVSVTTSPYFGSLDIAAMAYLCIGDTVEHLISPSSATGGTWSIADPSVATIVATPMSSSLLMGIAAGTTTLSYTLTNSCGSTVATRTIPVYTPVTPGFITGPTSPCAGDAVTYTYSYDVTPTGGIPRWRSSNTSVATVALGTGVGTALSPGTTIISMAIENACSYDSTTLTINVQPAPNAGTISGASTVCVGSSITLTESVSGGTWSSGSASVATVNSSGVVTGLSAGTAIISYSVTNSCGTATAIHTVLVTNGVDAGVISGSTAWCVGAGSTTLTSTVTGGVWSSSAPAVASVTSGGAVIGMSAGTATISYIVTNSCGTDTSYHSITINPAPNAGAISGPTTVCVGSSISLTESVTGGTWGSGTPATATVNSSGVVTGIVAGTAFITYTVTNSCGTANALYTVVVNPPTSAGTISGSPFVCIGATASLTSTVTPGTWTSSNPLVVAINTSTGVMTGIGSGTSIISYTVTGTCGTGISTYTVTSGASAVVAPITGPTSVCAGAAITLANASTGGTWSSSAPSVATVSATGVVTGVSAGTVNITYSITSGCGTAFATYTVTVNSFPSPGVITGPFELCTGTTVSMGASVSGGTWSSTATSVATVDGSGNVTAVTAGTTIIVYTVTSVCGSATALHTVVVTTTPSGAAITGPTTVCQGSTATLSGTPAGGIWSASNASATISSGGLLFGVAPGIDTIYYTISNTCGTSVGMLVDTVFPTSLAGGPFGPAVACIGDTLPYLVGVVGGTWHMSNGNAVVDSVTGLVIPVSPGLDTLSYTFTNICGTYSGNLVINVMTAADCAALGVNGVVMEGVRIYPNPTDGLFSVQLPQLAAEVIITITDVTGKVVDLRKTSTGSHTEEFNVKSLAAGSYFIKVSSGSLTYRDKIVIW